MNKANILPSEESAFNQHLRLLYENIKLPLVFFKIVQSDSSKSYTIQVKNINNTFLETFNTSYSDLIDKYVNELIPELDEEQLSKYCIHLSKEKSLCKSFFFKPGSRYIELNACHIKDDLFASTIIDKTEAKNVENELLDSKKKFKSLLNALPDVMLIIAENGNYLDVYTSRPELLSLSKDKLLQSSIHTRFSPEIAMEAQRIIHKVLKEKALHTYEYPIILNGKKCWFEAHITPYDSIKEKSVVWLSRDITDKKDIEHDLIQARLHAEESDQLKSNFLANMSHEIRTPMNGILGFTGLLNDDRITKEERKRYIKMINNSTEILLKLIDDIVDLSKIEAGQIRIEEDEHYINVLMNDLHTLFDEIKNSKGKQDIEFRLNKPSVLDNPKFIIDSMRFTQIMTNLIGNAFKFTESGYVEIGYKLLADNRFEFYVKDSGIGIEPDKQEVIFERFRQADNAQTRSFGGTGLGLAISKGLVEMLGGEIKLASKKGKGSTFFVYIPNKYPSNKSAENLRRHQERLTYNWQNKVLLIVEDNEISYRLIEIILKKTNATLIRSTNGLEAIKYIREGNNADLVLMDIHMPEMDGFEATRIIKKYRNNLPVIAQTAYVMAEEKEKCLESGCSEIITKPIEEHILLQKLNMYLY